MNFFGTNISALIINTFVREYRNKFLHFVTGFTILLIVLFHFAEISFNGNSINAQNTMQSFYRFIFVWVNIMSAMIGVQMIRNDSDNAMLSQVLSFPVSRFEYLLARVFSGWIIITSYYLLSILFFGLLSLVLKGQAGFSLQIFYSIVVASFASLAVIILGAFTSLSLNKIPAFLSTMFLTLLIWIAVYYFSHITNWKEIEWTVMNVLGFLFYAVFPHISVVNDIAVSILNSKPLEITWWFEVPHFFLSTFVWFSLTWFVLRKKDI